MHRHVLDNVIQEHLELVGEKFIHRKHKIQLLDFQGAPAALVANHHIKTVVIVKAPQRSEELVHKRDKTVSSAIHHTSVARLPDIMTLCLIRVV